MKKMRMLGTAVGLVLTLGVFGSVTNVSADSIGIDFERIVDPTTGPNGPVDIASQFHLNISDSITALSDYNVQINPNQILLTFTNTAVYSSSISEIYIDDTTGDPSSFTFAGLVNSVDKYTATSTYTDYTFVTNDITSTNFTGGDANPGVLPGGETLNPPFDADIFLSADAQGNPSFGVDSSTDILGVVYNVLPTLTILDGIESAIDSGAIRFGLHVRSIKEYSFSENEWSDAFVSSNGSPTAVPEPATMLIFGTGLAGIAVVSRRKKK